jgi:hypothetical protein
MQNNNIINLSIGVFHYESEIRLSEYPNLDWSLNGLNGDNDAVNTRVHPVLPSPSQPASASAVEKRIAI